MQWFAEYVEIEHVSQWYICLAICLYLMKMFVTFNEMKIKYNNITKEKRNAYFKLSCTFAVSRVEDAISFLSKTMNLEGEKT